MATAVISVDAFNLLLAEAVDAMNARDWGTAFLKVAAAEATNAGLETSVSDRGTSVQRRESLAKTLDMLEQARALVTAAETTGGSRIVRARTNYS